jgi:hypothetical protein
MLISQASYRGAGLEAPLATLTVVNPVVAAAVGITMFGETFRYGATGTALALGCGVVAAGGLILLTIERIGSGDRTESAPPEFAAVPDADAGPPADDAHGPAEEPAPAAVAAAAVSEPRLSEPVVPAVSQPRFPEPAVPVVADLGALTVTEATVEELLAGLPSPAAGEDGFVPPSQPGARSLAPRAGGESLLLPTERPTAGGASVPAPLKAAVPAREVVASRGPAARDELPYLTAMLGVPYVPMPFVNHHRTRVRS